MSAVASRLTPERVGLSSSEYALIEEHLGREPNDVELGMLGAMWSEHCGYKHTRPLLKQLPSRGPRVVQGPGENAGAVAIGGGVLVVLKMESHNHPSAIEPYQGAATGVGGIVRDIFTMGARPVALLDSLRFGPPDTGRGVKMVTQLSDLGYAPAQRRLARLYLEGLLVPRDLAKAKQLFEKAAKAGDTEARQYLQWIEQSER